MKVSLQMSPDVTECHYLFQQTHNQVTATPASNTNSKRQQFEMLPLKDPQMFEDMGTASSIRV